MRSCACVTWVSRVQHLCKCNFGLIELCRSACDNHLAAVICLELRAGLPKSDEQRLRHYRRPCTAVSDDMGQILNIAELIDGDGDDTGVDGTQESDRPIVGIGGDQQHALFAAQPQLDQRIAELSDPKGEFLKRELFAIVEVCELGTACRVFFLKMAREVEGFRDLPRRRGITHARAPCESMQGFSAIYRI